MSNFDKYCKVCWEIGLCRWSDHAVTLVKYARIGASKIITTNFPVLNLVFMVSVGLTSNFHNKKGIKEPAFF